MSTGEVVVWCFGIFFSAIVLVVLIVAKTEANSELKTECAELRVKYNRAMQELDKLMAA